MTTNRFFVGQKVKIIGPDYADNLGKETTVKALGQSCKLKGGPMRFDGIQVDSPIGSDPVKHLLYGDYEVYPPECLKPINDGNDKISWEDMRGLWQPNKETA